MKFYVFVIVIFLSSVAFSAKTKTAGAPDPDYIFALSAADHFLQAWEARDYEAGVVMLTDAAKQGTSESQVGEFFSAEQQGPRAYEVVRGKKLVAGRYEFPVVLFDGKASNSSPRYSRLVVIKEGRHDWVIDRLP